MKVFFSTAGAVVCASLLSACADDVVSPLAPDRAAVRAVAPAKAHAGRDWARLSADEVWDEVSATDTSVIVGLTAPGHGRGVVNGAVVVSRAQWDAAERAVLALPGIRLMERDTILPTLRVRVADLEALRRVKQLPLVGYVEPAIVRLRQGEQLLAGGAGCHIPFTSGGTFDVVSNLYLIYNDTVPGNYMRMRIPQAWDRSQGAGVTVGLIDTGVDRAQPEVSDRFNSGMSTGRFLWRDYTDGLSSSDLYLLDDPWSDNCGHGTHAGSVIAAPMNGHSIVGVAWKANLASVRHDSDVWGGFNVWNTTEAIDKAVGTYGSRVISLAFGSGDLFSSLEDKIRYWYQREVLFVGAAGTTPCLSPNDKGNVLFPAEMPEVLAVTGQDANGYLPCEVHYGPEVDLVASVGQYAAGAPSAGESLMGESGGSSNATALIAGIAALTWSQNPSLTRNQVRSRLMASGQQRNSPSSKTGNGLINAFCAVGGFCDVDIRGLKVINTAFNSGTHTYTALPYIGDGNFSYRWSNGATTPSVSVSVRPGSAPFKLSVTVTELSTGTTHTDNISVYVYYQAGCRDCLLDPNA